MDELVEVDGVNCCAVMGGGTANGSAARANINKLNQQFQFNNGAATAKTNPNKSILLFLKERKIDCWVGFVWLCGAPPQFSLRIECFVFSSLFSLVVAPPITLSLVGYAAGLPLPHHHSISFFNKELHCSWLALLVVHEERRGIELFDLLKKRMEGWKECCELNE